MKRFLITVKRFLITVLLALSCLFATSAQAQIPPYGIFVTQASPDGSFFWGRYFVPPTPSSSYFLMYNGSDALPKMGAIGTGLSWDGTTLSASGSTAPAPKVFSYPTRSLNSCYQPSATRDAQVSYNVDISTSLSLTTGQQGTVYLRTYTTNACSTGAQEVGRFANGQTGTLTIGLALTQNVTGNLTGIVPAGLWVQLVTESNVGAPTFTARPGQEVLL